MKANTAGEDWSHSWTIRASETESNPNHNLDNLDKLANGLSQGNAACFPPSAAFNQPFDDFAKDLVIKDAGKEDECRHVREELGFDKDHPHDTDVCREFEEVMCDPFFTGLENTLETPEFGYIEYEEVDYEEVDYEIPE